MAKTWIVTLTMTLTHSFILMYLCIILSDLNTLARITLSIVISTTSSYFSLLLPTLLLTIRHDKDIDSFLNDFEENAASMTLHPTSNSTTTTTNTTTNTNTNATTNPNHTATATNANSGGTNAIDTTTASNAITVAASVGSTGVVSHVPATACVNSVDDEDGTDAFMDELEDLIK